MSKHTTGAPAVMAVLLIAAMLVSMVCYTKSCGGVGGCGPTLQVQDATVQRMYVDKTKDGSAYMVGTDKGVFEVDNGILLGMWNADEVYSSLKEGVAYDLTTKGRTVQNLFMQEYPRIVKATVRLKEPAK